MTRDVVARAAVLARGFLGGGGGGGGGEFERQASSPHASSVFIAVVSDREGKLARAYVDHGAGGDIVLNGARIARTSSSRHHAGSAKEVMAECFSGIFGLISRSERNTRVRCSRGGSKSSAGGMAETLRPAVAAVHEAAVVTSSGSWPRAAYASAVRPHVEVALHDAHAEWCSRRRREPRTPRSGDADRDAPRFRHAT